MELAEAGRALDAMFEVIAERRAAPV